MRSTLLALMASISGIAGYQTAAACHPMPRGTLVGIVPGGYSPFSAASDSTPAPTPETARIVAEPAWVQTFALNAASTPPADRPCATTVTTESPGVATTTDSNNTGGTSGSGSNEFDISQMLVYDMKPGAANDKLDPAILARTHPVDLGMLPLEQLHGDPDDIEDIQSVFRKRITPGNPLRLMFWGASHVAGEYMTGQIRRTLQARYGDAGHGFVMPAAPWDGYRASDINICTGGTWITDFDNRKGGRRDGMLGPGGMSVEASAPESFGWVQTTTTNAQGRQVSRFEVMYLHQPGGGTLLATVDSEAPVEIATQGETGPGLAILEVPPGPHRLTLSPKGDGPARLLGVNLEDRTTAGVVVDAMGVNGRTAASWSRWDMEQMEMWLVRRFPDLLVLAYGTNEANDASITAASYEATLRSVLGRIRKIAPATPCVLMGPGDRGKKVSSTRHVIWGPTRMIAEVQEKVAPEFHCVSWNVQAAMGGEGSVFGWRTAEPSLMASDLIHFSAAGYQELGTRFLQAAGYQP